MKEQHYVLIFSIVCTILFFWFIIWFSGPTTKKQAVSYFKRVTGVVITNENQMIGFKNDVDWGGGEIGICVKLSEKEIQEIITAPPPLGTEWKNGPVYPNIPFICYFTYTNSYRGTPTPSEAIELVNSSNTLYCAKLKGPQKMPWHSGTLIIVDPINLKIWLSSWGS